MKVELKHPYGQGYVDGRHDAEVVARTEAFGAIRRAVEKARYHDKRCADWRRRDHQEAANTHAYAAKRIRRAIRAALGSGKV